MAHTESHLNPTRLVAVSVLLLCSITGLAYVPRILQGGLTGTICAFVLGTTVTFLLASLYEWWIHRFIYHESAGPLLRKIYRIHTAHHHLYFPTHRYVTNGSPRRIPIIGSLHAAQKSFFGNALTGSAHYAFYVVRIL